jgi:hypothetical protein
VPTPTYTPLATVTLGSSASSVTFSSIPATYRDLIVVASVKYSTSNGGYMAYRLNSDTGNNYSYVFMLGNGSSFSSGSGSGESFGRFGNASTADFESTIFNIFDYSATDKHKTGLSRTNIASIYTVEYASRWANTSAVNSITFSPDSGNFTANSNFSLYGIEA